MNKLMKRCAYGLAICVVLENFMLFLVMGAPVQPSHIIFIFAILTALVYSHFRVKRKYIKIMLLMLVLPLFVLYRINDIQEFFKSYIIYVLDIIFICVAIPKIVDVLSDARVYDKFLEILVGFISVAELIGILQFIINNTLGIDIAYGIFGRFESHICLTSFMFGVHRSYSIFHEPSVFAWICSFKLAILLYKGNRIISNKKLVGTCYLINGLAMLTTLSTIGYVAYILLIVTSLLVNNKTTIRRVFLTLGVCLGVYWILKYTNVGEVFSRISLELNRVDSSGYERTIVPLEYLKRTMRYYPVLGRGLGQNGYVDKVGIVGLTEGVNNSIVGIFIDFGLGAIIPIIIFLKSITTCLKKDKRFVLIVVNMLVVFFSTGAYMALSVVVVQICGYLSYYDPAREITCSSE